LAMIYVVKKFRHYLLGNSCVLCWSSNIVVLGQQTNGNTLNC
jgi:hypothetical protein